MKVDFDLREERPVQSRGYLNVRLMADGFENMQATAIFNFREYAYQPLKQIMNAAWARMPTHHPKRLPPGRAHWESSVALVDKSDSNEIGHTIDFGESTFIARHLNAKRSVFGYVRGTDGVSRPAEWAQRKVEPAIVGDLPGGLEGANDKLKYDVAGYVVGNSGTRPRVWTASEDGWKEHALPVEAFTIKGKAFDINDSREACGYVDVLVSKDSNRLPCFWMPNGDRCDELTILPVPEFTFSASALALNSRAVIVGYFKTAGGSARACMWEPGDGGYVFVDLETAGVARSINVIDQIVGGSNRSSYLWQCEERHDLSRIPSFAESGAQRVFGITYLGDLLARDDEGEMQVLTPVSALGLGR